MSQNILEFVTSAITETARRMDTAYPNWHNKVNIDILNIDDPSVCIVGQVTGSFKPRIFRKSIGYEDRNVFIGICCLSPSFGFVCINSDSWRRRKETIHQVWKEQILRRREAEKLALTAQPLMLQYDPLESYHVLA